MDTLNDTMTQMSSQALNAFSNFSRIWTDWMTSMATAGLSFTPGAPPAEAARQIRGSALRSMADTMDEMMRTPQFLEMMRQSMDAMLTWRKQLDNWMTQGRQATQGTTREDIDTLMVTIRHMERRILDRIEDVNGRMDEMEERLEQSAARTNGGPERRPRRPRARGESARQE